MRSVLVNEHQTFRRFRQDVKLADHTEDAPRAFFFGLDFGSRRELGLLGDNFSTRNHRSSNARCDTAGKRSHCPLWLERHADGVNHHLPDAELIPETHFAFGGMDVDVHLRGVDDDEEEGDRELSAHQRRVIALAQGEADAFALDGPAIHEDVLLGTIRAADAGFANEAGDLNVGGA